MEFRLQETLEILDRTPKVLDRLLRNLPDHWTRNDEGGDSWSPFDVLGHLVHGERSDWVTRSRIILEEGETRPFEPFDRFAMLEDSKGKTLTDLLDEFMSLRASNLATVRGWELSSAQLATTGRHPELGPVTLRQLLSTWAVHDLGHTAQIVRVMAKQYASEVGPWQAYLPVLRDRLGVGVGVGVGDAAAR